jgi:hypothetical protein
MVLRLCCDLPMQTTPASGMRVGLFAAAGSLTKSLAIKALQILSANCLVSLTWTPGLADCDEDFDPVA